MQINTNDLIHTSLDDIWKHWDPKSNGPSNIYQVEFIDGVLEMNAKHIIITRYLWEAHRMFPGTPIVKAHAFHDNQFGPTTHLGILENIVNDIRDHSLSTVENLDFYALQEALAKCVYQITNHVFNDFSVKLAEYVSTTRLQHYIDIVEHEGVKPKLESLYRQLNPSPMVMEDAYSHTKKALENVTWFPRNPIARAVRAGNTKIGSIQQSIVARGTPTDIDSRIFSKTIKTGYLRGIYTLVDQIMDSRTSAKSLSYQSKPMQDSEYLNRKLQLSGATFCNVHHCDCGSKRYDNVTIKVGSLKDYLGKFILDETGAERPIRKNDTALQGRTVKMRTVFGCQHPDPYGVCIRCLGELGYNLPKYTNVGHQFVINLQAPVGQLLLSDKHYVSTATGEGYELSSADRRIFENHLTDQNIIMFNKGLDVPSLKLRVLAQDALGLNDITPDINVDDLNIFRISSVAFIQVGGRDKLDREIYHEFITCTNAATRKLSFSTDVLRYIQRTGYSILDDGSYEIDFSHYDFSKPLLILPRTQFSTVDYMKNIEKFTRGEGTKEMPSMVDYSSNIAAVQGFHEIVSERMNVNFACLEVIAISHSARDIEAKDYRLPADKSKAQLAKYNNIMNYRSLSAKMAYQGHVKVMFSETAFTIRRRPSHHLDPVLLGGYTTNAYTKV